MGIVYSVFKVVFNMVVVKYSVEYCEKGVVVFVIFFGVVDIGMFGKFICLWVFFFFMMCEN